MFFVLLKGSSQYGALELHIDQLATALKAAGHQAEVLDVSAPDFAPRLLDAAGRRPEVFFSLNGIGSDLQIGGVSAYDRVGSAFTSLYVDSPLHHLGRLAVPAQRKAALFLDETHAELARAGPWSGGFRSIAFLPPGAIVSTLETRAAPDNFGDRAIDLLFTGTYRGEAERPWRSWPPGPSRAVLDDIADRMAAAGDLPIREALVRALKVIGAELTPERLNNFLPVLHLPQRFAETYHRAAFVRTLGEAGAPVTVFGQGWAAVAERFPSFDYRGPGSFGETLALLGHTRIVLNTNNGFLAGGHERVFTAMSAGAHVFSDASTFYARSFEEDREISTFRWRDVAKAPARLEALLADVAALAARAAAGQGRALREHGWASRVDGLLKALEGV